MSIEAFVVWVLTAHETGGHEEIEQKIAKIAKEEKE
jgi:hypothetical protein